MRLQNSSQDLKLNTLSSNNFIQQVKTEAGLDSL